MFARLDLAIRRCQLCYEHVEQLVPIIAGHAGRGFVRFQEVARLVGDEDSIRGVLNVALEFLLTRLARCQQPLFFCQRSRQL